MDTLLASLQYGASGVFNLARNLGSISIRDQMIRATLVAHALPVWLRQRYGTASAEKPVLVVGAGASGMTLAVGLARRGIRVEVVDTDERAFGLQRRCKSRWIDGVQDDWPMDQWARERFPWDVQAYRSRQLIPFPFEAGLACDLVGNCWDRDLDGYLSGPLEDLLKFHPGRYLYRYPRTAEGEGPWLVARLKDCLRQSVV
jgi:hypothetical protein